MGCGPSEPVPNEVSGPFPEFALSDTIALHYEDLDDYPYNDCIHPSIIDASLHIENPIARYYLYFAPHKHDAISMCFSDSLEGPWSQYEENPVIEGPSAPDMRWIEEVGQYVMWGHSHNSHTDYWFSSDGINFDLQGESINGSAIDCGNATYTRVYEYPLEVYDSKYIMVYSGKVNSWFGDSWFGDPKRHVWLAYSSDGTNWTQLTTPLVKASSGEKSYAKQEIYGPSFLQYDGSNYVVYQDNNSEQSGGIVKYVKLNGDLDPIGEDRKRNTMLIPSSEDPYNNRYRGGEFYQDGDMIYYYTGTGNKYSEVIVYASTTWN